jgi:lipoteichoic acid synthase
MFAQLQTAARKGIRLSLNGLQLWPFWGITLLIVSMLYKLNWLDHQFNVGGMNHWKWAVNLGALLFATFWMVFLGKRGRVIAVAIVDTALSFLLFADLVYFRYFKDFISVPVLLQAGQVGELGASIWSLIQTRDWLLFADIPIALGATVWAFFRIKAERRTRVHISYSRTRIPLWRKAVPAAAAAALAWSLIYFPVEIQKNGWARGLFAGNWWNIPIYNVTGLLGFHGYDTYRYAKEHWFGAGLSKEQTHDAQTWFMERQKLQKQMESEPLYGAYKGKNVLIVQAEAFQEFVIGKSVNGKEVTPNLNKLIEQSAYFPNFYHQTAQGRTSDADFATSCSMHPLPTGSVFIRFAGNTFDCMPSILKGAGYDTTVHHAYDGSFWNRYNMYSGMQYDKFYTVNDYKIDEPMGWSLGDKSFFRQTIDQLKERKNSPFYALTITLSSHHPYNLPYSKRELNVGSFNGTMFGDYLQSVRYVDSAVGELVALLKKQGLWDDTILVFYGDHDNSITDWKPYEQFFGQPVTALDKDAIVKKVPMIIHLPHDEHAGIVDKAAGQMDTAPTLMQLLGLSLDGRYMMGVSMFSQAAKSVVFRNGGFTDGKVYYAPSGDGIAGHGSCYSLPDGESIDSSSCASGAEAAKRELEVSDRVIEHNLILRFRDDEK